MSRPGGAGHRRSCLSDEAAFIGGDDSLTRSRRLVAHPERETDRYPGPRQVNAPHQAATRSKVAPCARSALLRARPPRAGTSRERLPGAWAPAPPPPPFPPPILSSHPARSVPARCPAPTAPPGSALPRSGHLISCGPGPSAAPTSGIPPAPGSRRRRARPPPPVPGTSGGRNREEQFRINEPARGGDPPVPLGGLPSPHVQSPGRAAAHVPTPSAGWNSAMSQHPSHTAGLPRYWSE